MDDNLGWWLAFEMGFGKQSCGTEPLTCGIWCYLWIDSVRMELNAGVQELLVGVGKNLHTFGDQSVRSQVFCANSKKSHKRERYRRGKTLGFFPYTGRCGTHWFFFFQYKPQFLCLRILPPFVFVCQPRANFSPKFNKFSDILEKRFYLFLFSLMVVSGKLSQAPKLLIV